MRSVRTSSNFRTRSAPSSGPWSTVAGDKARCRLLRAGLGLVDGVKDLIPNVSFGYIGVQRNEETAEPENYYEKLPELNDKNVFILEPMLATGGSLSFAIETVKKYNPKNIHALTVIAAPEGIELIKEKHADIVETFLEQSARIEAPKNNE